MRLASFTRTWRTTRRSTSGERGFSLVEAVVAVAIIMIMAAVALPNISGYLRNYKLRGSAQDVSGEMQASRSKAIMSNTNNGVFFAVVDADSYRWVMADDPVGEELGPLRDLPAGIEFAVSGELDSGEMIRFNRLGGFCNPVANPLDLRRDGTRSVHRARGESLRQLSRRPLHRAGSGNGRRNDVAPGRVVDQPRADRAYRPRRPHPPAALKKGAFRVPHRV